MTGAAGFLGRHVVEALAARGHEVRGLVRPGSGAARLPWRERAEPVEADVSRDDLADALSGIDAVAHLAARVEGSDAERFAGTVATTERLLDAMRDAGVRRLVLVSSYAVYDWSRAGPLLDESCPVVQGEKLYERDGYAVAKVWQERVARAAADRDGLELTVLRPGFVWGPGRIEQAGAGIGLGPLHLVVGPRARLPLTYVENCADCVAAAVDGERAPGRTLNVVDGDGVAAWRYAGELRPPRVRVPVPYALGLAVARLARALSRRVFRYGGRLPSVLVPARFEARFKPLRHSSAEARRVLGWQPRVGFEEALRRSRPGGGGG